MFQATSFVVAFWLLASGMSTPHQQVVVIASSAADATISQGWTNVTGANGPPAMAGAMMAYSSKDDVFLLFGGWNGVTYNQTWLFDPVRSAWTQVHTTTHPAARGDGMLAFDSEANAFVLFGGWFETPSDSYVRLQDTWVFYLTNDTWSERHPSSSPSARSDSAVAYDPDRGMTVLFGGFSGTAYLGDLWYYVFGNDSWISRNSAAGPSPRADGRMVYDPARSFYLFSGNDYSGPDFAFHHLADMWRYDWDLNKWTQLFSSVMPSARDYPVFATDSAFGELILTGGFGNRTILGDTWAFNSTRSAWANITTAVGPNPRMAAVGGYDSQDDVLVLFSGGDNSGAKGDTWLFRYPPRIEGGIELSRLDPMVGQSVDFEALLRGGSGTFVDAQWQFGDGDVESGLRASHAYATAGLYHASFNATDSRGDVVAWSVDVSVGQIFPLMTEIAFLAPAAVSAATVALWIWRRSRSPVALLPASRLARGNLGRDRPRIKR